VRIVATGREIAERRRALGALQALLEHAPLRREPVPLQHLAYEIRKDREISFLLHDVVVGAELHRLDGELRRRRGRDEERRRRHARGANLAQ